MRTLATLSYKHIGTQLNNFSIDTRNEVYLDTQAIIYQAQKKLIKQHNDTTGYSTR